MRDITGTKAPSEEDHDARSRSEDTVSVKSGSTVMAWLRAVVCTSRLCVAGCLPNDGVFRFVTSSKVEIKPVASMEAIHHQERQQEDIDVEVFHQSSLEAHQSSLDFDHLDHCCHHTECADADRRQDVDPK